MTTSALWCAAVLEIIFLLFYVIIYKRYKKIRRTGRVHDINYTRNWAQFFKILMIFLPVLLLLFIKNPFM